MTKIYVSHPFGGLAKNKKNADSAGRYGRISNKRTFW